MDTVKDYKWKIQRSNGTVFSIVANRNLINETGMRVRQKLPDEEKQWPSRQERKSKWTLLYYKIKGKTQYFSNTTQRARLHVWVSRYSGPLGSQKFHRTWVKTAGTITSIVQQLDWRKFIFKYSLHVSE